MGRGGLHPLLLARNAISVAFVVDYIRSHSSIFLVLRHDSMRWIVEVVHIR